MKLYHALVQFHKDFDIDCKISAVSKEQAQEILTADYGYKGIYQISLKDITWTVEAAE